jgi:hydroxymethylbilane synthase
VRIGTLTSTPLRIGTRGSTLATTQTGMVADRLAGLTGLDVELVRITTDGDVRTGSLAQLGGTGVFVTALREALLDGRCDVAVHSLKDLPVAPAPGLRLVTPERENPRDVLCTRTGKGLADLPEGARVGTGSPRRAAQLLAARPDLDVVDIRGNIDTRLGRVDPETGDLDGVVLAYAGLARIGRLTSVAEVFEPDVLLPAPGQGSLAIEVRELGESPSEAEVALHHALDALSDRDTTLSVTAERAFLARLEAGCAAPLGALARIERTQLGQADTVDTVDAVVGGLADGAGRPDCAEELVLDAVAVTTDGATEVRRSARLQASGCGITADDAAALGARLADEIAERMPSVVGTGR